MRLVAWTRKWEEGRPAWLVLCVVFLARHRHVIRRFALRQATQVSFLRCTNVSFLPRAQRDARANKVRLLWALSRVHQFRVSYRLNAFKRAPVKPYPLRGVNWERRIRSGVLFDRRGNLIVYRGDLAVRRVDRRRTLASAHHTKNMRSVHRIVRYLLKEAANGLIKRQFRL